ncbi:MAG TPA: vitamin K epoxide reductase family protein [Acidimicrobiales bacterium]|nr:vitamin K epoxide reductase family protein [Acidimicrobiales bacterium]
MTRETNPVPRWAVIVSFLLSLAGLGVSLYLTIAHFDKQILACSSTGVIDCAAVTSSPQSYILGVPVAFFGLGNFIVMTALNSPWGWRLKPYWVHVTRFVLSVVGMVSVLWLVYAELIIINHICLYCTAVHIITFALLIVLAMVSPTQLGWARSVPE